MDAAEVVKRFMRAGEEGDWETFANSMAENYVFRVHNLQQGKREMLSSQKALWGAFPDLNFNLRITEVQGDVVKGTFQLSGTHTGTLIPPVPGAFVSVAPTGKKVLLAENTVDYTVQDGKVVEQNVSDHPNSGWRGILTQLGVENPYT